MDFAHGAIQWSTSDTAGTDHAVSGLGFQPKAVRFYWVGIGSPTDGTSSVVSSFRGVGFASDASGSIVQRAVTTTSTDNSGSANCGSYATDAACVAQVSNAGAVLGLLSMVSFDSDGFTLNVDDTASQTTSVFWEAWGGSDITDVTIGDIAEPAATGTQNYTADGFTSTDDDSQVVMLAGVQTTAALPGGAGMDSGLFIGFATGTASGENVVLTGNSDDASATMDTDGYCRTGECLAMLVVDSGNPNARATLSAFGTDQFTLDWLERTTSNRRSIYMAIKGGSWKAGAFTINGNTANATATVSGLDFEPKGVSFMSRFAAESASDTADVDDLICLGTASSTSSRRALGVLDNNGTGSADIQTSIQYDQCLTGNAASLHNLDLNAMNSDGFEVIVDTTGGVASEWVGYLTYGDGVAGAVDLDPSLYADADTFFAAAVAAGAVDLTPALYSDGDSFAQPTVSATYALTPALFAEGDTFHAPTVTVGAVDLAPELFAEGDTFHAATVAQVGGETQDLAPALFSDGDSFFSATVAAGAVALTPSLYADGDAFHTATVAPGAVELAPALYAEADSFFSATVAAGAVNLAPSLFVDGDTFPSAVVSSGGAILAPELFADGDTFYSPTATPGAVGVEAALFADGDTFHAPAASTTYDLTPERYDDGDIFFAPTVAGAEAQSLEPELFADADTFYSPTVAAETATTGGLLRRRGRGKGSPFLTSPGESAADDAEVLSVAQAFFDQVLRQ